MPTRTHTHVYIICIYMSGVRVHAQGRARRAKRKGFEKGIYTRPHTHQRRLNLSQEHSFSVLIEHDTITTTRKNIINIRVCSRIMI